MADTRRKPAMLLFGAILLLAVATRLIGLDAAPPGLIPDEASNAYDAYSLLETGRDRWGTYLPLHLEAFGAGDFRPALYAYLTVPFVALLGPERLDIAVRLPAACWAVLSVACLYIVVGMVCDRRTALWAALMLTLAPWFLRMSRFGHESALTPGFPIMILCVLVWANAAPRGDGRRVSGMVVGGVMMGLALYCYASLRLFVPAMVLAGAFVYRASWRASWRMVLLGAVPFLLVAAPLAWSSWQHWDQIGGRARYASLFHQGMPVLDALKQVVIQYAGHFGPGWLFVRGDTSVLSSTPGIGQFNWMTSPLLVVGVVVMWRQRRVHRIYAIVLAWLLLHPLASAVCTDGPHTNRAALGIGAFLWVAAVGASTLTTWLRWRALAVGLVIAVLASGAWSSYAYLRHVRGPELAALLQSDLRDAVRTIRHRWEGYDRVFISDHTSNEHRWGNEHPYIYVLTYLPVAPVRFHAWEKSVGYRRPEHGFHYVESMGPFVFNARPDSLAEQFTRRPDERVLVVARPGDLRGGRVLESIRDSSGAVRFDIIEVVR